MAVKNTNVSWRLNFRIHMFLKKALNLGKEHNWKVAKIKLTKLMYVEVLTEVSVKKDLNVSLQ